MGKYTAIDDPSAHFQATLWTGDGNDNKQITNAGNSDLKPDLVWLKDRTQGESHALFDSSRGASVRIQSNNNGAESTETATLKSFTTDGFTVGTSGSVNNGSNPDNYVAWQWKANGGTTSSNTDGNVTNTLQVNQDAGFSISKFTSASSGNTTIGHGLGVTPDVFIVKIASGTGGWWMNHKGLTNQSDRYLGLNSTQAESTLSWGAAPTSTLITAASGFIGNGTTTVMCYAFAEKQGYSKFGSYKGNSHSGGDGTFVYTGFAPAWVLIKRTDAVNDWIIHDYKLGTKASSGSEKGNVGNLNNAALRANETSTVDDWGSIDMLSNGFKLRSDAASGNAAGTYIYMAFADNPFTTSTGVPCTAR